MLYFYWNFFFNKFNLSCIRLKYEKSFPVFFTNIVKWLGGDRAYDDLKNASQNTGDSKDRIK